MLSVVIPTYNRAKTLPRVLASIARQTVLPNEVIVVDDGSTDDTLEVLEGWKSSLPLKIIHQENLGASAARNAGIRAAAGDVIAFIDSDDEYEPNAIWVLRRLFCDPSTVVAFGDLCVLDADGRYITESFLRTRLITDGVHFDGSRLVDPLGLLICGAFLGAFACRKEALLAVGGYDETLPRCNDRDLYLRLSANTTGDWAFTWNRLETKHYTEGSLSSRKSRRLHYEAQLRVLGKFADATPLTPLGMNILAGAAKQSALGAIDWAGRESPAQVVRTMRGIPRFARTRAAYYSAARAFGLSIARAVRDRVTPRAQQPLSR